jgi:hypothetical protein
VPVRNGTLLDSDHEGEAQLSIAPSADVPNANGHSNGGLTLACSGPKLLSPPVPCGRCMLRGDLGGWVTGACRFQKG